jgi:CTP synthase
MKTKPTQHSVKALREIGIQPDIILCRSARPVEKELKNKIALFCSTSPSTVFDCVDVDTVYAVPRLLSEQGLDDKVADMLNICSLAPALTIWRRVVHTLRNPKHCVRIGVVGKYVHLIDSYKSLHEALVHGGLSNESRVEIVYLDAENFLKTGTHVLRELDGILIPGGFGERGSVGMIQAIQWARTAKVPYFGICLGMQMMVVEYARNIAGLEGANSTEFNHLTSYPVIDLMEEQKKIENKGGTMRCGAYACKLVPGSKASSIYCMDEIYERHRHRFEVNNKYRKHLSECGLVFSGLSPDGRLVEICELPEHPWFIGCQFHPEFKSRPLDPHPLFASFVGACIQSKKNL